MTYLTIRGISKRFGDTLACDDISFGLEQGRVLALLGPSGCGKSTTLRTLAGFERPDSGEIVLDGRVLASDSRFVAPEKRGMGVVFQSYALWPHMTLIKQVAFGLTMRGTRSTSAAVKAREALKLVHLDGLEERYPHELSGGQQQRVALARAIVIEPQLILLDEPLSNLDSRLRENMRFELKRLQQSLGQTMVYVTHDQSEALSLADEVAVLNGGRIEQIGTPEEIYFHPRTQFVAQALGSANLISATVLGVDAESVRIRTLGSYELAVTRPTWLTGTGNGLVGRPVTITMRPTDVRVGGVDESSPLPRARITERLFGGDHYDYIIESPAADRPLRASLPDNLALRAGENVTLELVADKISILEEVENVQSEDELAMSID